MTDQPWGLLVVPSDALRGMLDGGACGFRPPTAYDCMLGDEERAPRWKANDLTMDIEPWDALALRWDGQDLPHGWLAADLATLRDAWGYRRPEVLRVLRVAGCTIIAINEQGHEVPND